MPIALRPLPRPALISSWNGKQALADGLRDGRGGWEPVVTRMFPLAGFAASDPVVTSASLAGFAVPSPSDPVVTSLAGFESAGGSRPQRPGDRMGTPAARRYPAAVSRRTPAAGAAVRAPASIPRPRPRFAHYWRARRQKSKPLRKRSRQRPVHHKKPL